MKQIVWRIEEVKDEVELKVKKKIKNTPKETRLILQKMLKSKKEDIEIDLGFSSRISRTIQDYIQSGTRIHSDRRSGEYDKWLF